MFWFSRKVEVFLWVQKLHSLSSFDGSKNFQRSRTFENLVLPETFDITYCATTCCRISEIYIHEVILLLMQLGIKEYIFLSKIMNTVCVIIYYVSATRPGRKTILCGIFFVVKTKRKFDNKQCFQ